MSESIQLNDPLYKLIVRFGNGEMVQYIMQDPIDARSITPETRYAVITSSPCQNPSECSEVSIVNLRDVTFFKSERVTLDNLAAERRLAGIRSPGASSAEEHLPKVLAHVKFI